MVPEKRPGQGRAKSALLAATVAGAMGGFIGLAGAGTAHADPVSLTLQYTCTFPLIGAQPLQVVINTDIPTSVPVGEPTPEFDIQAVSTVNEKTTQGLSLVGAKTIEGTADSSAQVAAPEGELPVSVPIALEKTDVPESGAFDINASGITPALTFQQPGPATITVSDLLLTLTPRNAAGEETGLGTFESKCSLDPADQDNVLAEFEITGTGTTTGGTTTGGTTTGGDTGGDTTGGDTTGGDSGGDTTGGDSGGDTTGGDTGGDSGATTTGTSGGDSGTTSEGVTGSTTGETGTSGTSASGTQLGGGNDSGQLAVTGAMGSGGLILLSGAAVIGGLVLFRYVPRLSRRGAGDR